MGNPIALLALFAWPIFAVALFHAKKSEALERVIIWLVVWAYMFLPQRVSIDLPALPPLDKITIPNLVLFFLLLGLPRRQGRLRIFPKSMVGAVLIIMFFISPLITNLTNGDALFRAGHYFKELSLHDGISDMIRDVLRFMPFFIGYSFLGSERAQREFLHAIVMAGLIYSVLIIFENRFSPQLHTWIYGFFQHSFAQHVRGGVYRPIVFMEHGLYVAFFCMTVTVSAAILWKAMPSDDPLPERAWHRPRKFYLQMIGWLFVTLVLTWSLGSLLFALLLVPVVLFTSKKTQLTIAAAMVLIAITYPSLRGAGWIPTEALVEQFKSISEERAHSLNYRFENEEELLERAAKRPAFGWGGWRRSRVYDEITGKDIAETDGFWIIIIGTQGWFGYIATFGILVLPVLVVFGRMLRHGADAVNRTTCGLALLLAINMIELLPNSTLPPWTWLIAGMLLGHADRQQTEAGRQDQPPEDVALKPPRRRTVL